jgi:hypothetical protein
MPTDRRPLLRHRFCNGFRALLIPAKNANDFGASNSRITLGVNRPIQPLPIIPILISEFADCGSLMNADLTANGRE